MDLVAGQLDEIPNLRTMSITGGEPMFSKKSIRNVLTIKVCTSSRYIYTNKYKHLTLPQDRYLNILSIYRCYAYITHNWGPTDEFANVGFGAMKKQPPLKAKLKLYRQNSLNARTLSEQGMLLLLQINL